MKKAKFKPGDRCIYGRDDVCLAEVTIKSVTEDGNYWVHFEKIIKDNDFGWFTYCISKGLDMCGSEKYLKKIEGDKE